MAGREVGIRRDARNPGSGDGRRGREGGVGRRGGRCNGSGPCWSVRRRLSGERGREVAPVLGRGGFRVLGGRPAGGQRHGVVLAGWGDRSRPRQLPPLPGRSCGCGGAGQADREARMSGVRPVGASGTLQREGLHRPQSALEDNSGQGPDPLVHEGIPQPWREVGMADAVHGGTADEATDFPWRRLVPGFTPDEALAACRRSGTSEQIWTRQCGVNVGRR
jgi:hypothetical protein